MRGRREETKSEEQARAIALASVELKKTHVVDGRAVDLEVSISCRVRGDGLCIRDAVKREREKEKSRERS